jgi:nicotinamide-nucleotide amidase
MLAALLTDIDGAGHGFDRGFVTYTKEANRTCSEFRAICWTTTMPSQKLLLAQWRRSPLARSQADFAVGVTDFAGPAGGLRRGPGAYGVRPAER